MKRRSRLEPVPMLDPVPAVRGPAVVPIADRRVGEGEPVFVIAEIGINHNGSLAIAKRLIDGAVLAGCDAVKFQKRTPELAVPRDQWDIERDTPWGRMRYIDYKHKIELGENEFEAIDRYCRERDVLWFASCWDEPSVDFIERFEPPCYKAASASLTDHGVLRRMKATGRPLVMSTGMSTLQEIEEAVREVGEDKLLLAHTTSAYPCPPDQLNLRMIDTLRDLHPGVPVGYSGHEAGLSPTLAAVAMGATFIERHITLDKSMWGTDQSASLDIVGLVQLVSAIRDIERSLGDGVKRVHEAEVSQRNKLRRARPDLQQPAAAGDKLPARA